MPPIATCVRMSAITTKKYLRVALIDGVATALSKGSFAAACGSGGSLCAAWYQIIAAMAAINRMIDAMLHMAAEVVIALPTSGSYGQLLVYERPVSPGRSVQVDHADQKKKAVNALRCTASGSAPLAMAYCSRRSANAGSLPNRPSKCSATRAIARARSALT